MRRLQLATVLVPLLALLVGCGSTRAAGERRSQAPTPTPA